MSKFTIDVSASTNATKQKTTMQNTSNNNVGSSGGYSQGVKGLMYPNNGLAQSQNYGNSNNLHINNLHNINNLNLKKDIITSNENENQDEDENNIISARTLINARINKMRLLFDNMTLDIRNYEVKIDEAKSQFSTLSSGNAVGKAIDKSGSGYKERIKMI